MPGMIAMISPVSTRNVTGTYEQGYGLQTTHKCEVDHGNGE